MKHSTIYLLKPHRQMSLKRPEDCRDMTEIRQAIDALDHQVITAWGQRFAYVKAASRFKTSEADVQAPERFAAMLAQRRQWAQEKGLNPDVIESVYRDLVKYFISEEMQRWQQSA